MHEAGPALVSQHWKDPEILSEYTEMAEVHIDH